MKLYLTFDPKQASQTALFWSKKADAQQHAKGQSHEFYQYEVEARRADIVDWLNNSIMPDVFHVQPEDQEPTHDAQPTVDVDPETGEILNEDPAPGDEPPGEEPVAEVQAPAPEPEPEVTTPASGPDMRGELTPEDAHSEERRRQRREAQEKANHNVYNGMAEDGHPPQPDEPGYEYLKPENDPAAGTHAELDNVEAQPEDPTGGEQPSDDDLVEDLL